MGLITLGLAGLLLAGCAVVHGGPPGVIVGPGALGIPPGHYPPPGHCRVWYPDRPPGQQPPPVACPSVVVLPGTFVLYDQRAWDVDYDWAAHARRHPGSVPRVILDLTQRRR